MAKKESANYFHGDTWFDRQIHLRVTKSLPKLHEGFAKDHKTDTDQQLLEYLQKCARELGKTPNAGEIIGGPYISARFGTWRQAVLLAGLKYPGKMPQYKHRQIYKIEYKRQAELFRQERAAAKRTGSVTATVDGAEGRTDSTEIHRKEQERRLEEDLAWGEQHSHLNDHQLLELLRQKAAELGNTPTRKDVEGGRYIAQHFGSWAVALELAGLALPKDLKPAKPSKVLEWRKRLARLEKEQ